MGNKTGIEWTDATWNPVRGCSRVSEGCRNCYAESVAYRFSGPGQPYEGLVTIGADGERKRQWNGQVRFVEDHLRDPLKWKAPRRIFVNSMSDLFHENVPDEWIDRIFAVMALCPQHTFQVLTKRPERMKEYLSYHYRVVSPGPRENVYGVIRGAPGYDHEHPKWLRTANAASSLLSAGPLPNVWLGASVESPKHKYRIDILRETPAAVRFLSLEPLLADLGDLDLRGIDWVICGGESGPGARPMHPDWARSLRDQCVAAKVPFFFKQWGEWAPSPAKPVYGKHTGGGLFLKRDGKCGNQGDFWVGNAAAVDRVGKKAAGALLDGREWKEFPAVGA